MKILFKCFMIGFILVIGMALGVVIGQYGENNLMGEYKLYQCIYNNADDNGFSDNPYIIQKIQEECMCFFEHNFTNVFENC